MDKNKFYTYGIWATALTLLGIGVYLLTKKRKKKVDCTSRMLFLGSSGTVSPSSYADQLKDNCPDLNYKKIAMVGAKTDWMLNQLKQDTGKYDVITLLGGVNDIYAGVPLEKIKNNIQAIYDLAKERGAKVVAVTISPTATYNKATDKANKLTQELNDWIRSNKTADFFVDADKVWNDGRGGTKSEYLSADTLHINKSGHTALTNKYRQLVFS